MSFDVSRVNRGNASKYSELVTLQGRPSLDSDINESSDIARYRDETASRAIIGPVGAPADPDLHGFALYLEPAGHEDDADPTTTVASASDLTISAGEIFVEGRRIVNAAGTSLKTQPFIPLGAGEADLSADVLPTTKDTYVAYLETWEREVTAIIDPGLLETALGGVDTSGRLQTVWQVRLAPADGAGQCSDLLLPYQPSDRPKSDAYLAAQVQPAAAPDTCSLPPVVGFQGLDNQLYRVQVHVGGDAATARLKWSRENGSVELSVLQAGPDPNQFQVASIGRDETLQPQVDQWVELIDDRSELLGIPIPLVQVASIDKDHNLVTLNPGTTGVPTIDYSLHPRIRLWDQSGASADSSGIPADVGSWIDLELAVQIQLSGTSFTAGEYWLIPARTGLGDGLGSLDWPSDAGAPVPVEPDGGTHQFVALNLVDFDPATGLFTNLLPSCVPTFPALTSIDSAGECTWLVNPDDDMSVLTDLIAAGPSYGTLCFSGGEFDLSAPITIKGKTGIKITGAGEGTLLRCDTSEVAIIVDSCVGVTIRDLSIQTTADRNHTQGNLMGALHVTSCTTVTIDNVWVATSDRVVCDGACITVYNDPPGSTQSPDLPIVTVTSSRLRPGNEQIGLLVINAGKAVVRDVDIAAVSLQPPSTSEIMTDPQALAKYRKMLVSNAVLGPLPQGATPPVRAVTLTVNNQTIWFDTPHSLIKSWQKLVPLLGSPASSNELYAAVLDHADALLTSGQLASTRAFSQWYKSLSTSQAVASCGIIVAGQLVGNVVVSGVTIAGAAEGIRVASSNYETSGPFIVKSLTVRDTSIDLQYIQAAQGRFGIFVGNVDHAVIEGNRIFCNPLHPNANPIEGIRIWGYLGPFGVVRGNDLRGFQVGIRWAAVGPKNTPPPVKQPAWTIADNYLTGGIKVLDITPSANVVNQSNNVVSPNWG